MRKRIKGRSYNTATGTLICNLSTTPEGGALQPGCAGTKMYRTPVGRFFIAGDSVVRAITDDDALALAVQVLDPETVRATFGG